MSKVISYDEFRGQIKNADILLYRGTDVVSRGICFLTKSQYSHVGVVVWWNDRLMVLEAVGNGVVAMPLSMNLKKHRGGIDYFRAVTNIPDDKRLNMAVFAQEQLGKQYAFFQMAILGFKLLCRMKMSPNEKRAKGAAGQYFCSQYVSDTYLQQGYDLAIQYGNHYTSPDALAKSEKLIFVGMLRK